MQEKILHFNSYYSLSKITKESDIIRVLFNASKLIDFNNNNHLNVLTANKNIILLSQSLESGNSPYLEDFFKYIVPRNLFYSTLIASSNPNLETSLIRAFIATIKNEIDLEKALNNYLYRPYQNSLMIIFNLTIDTHKTYLPHLIEMIVSLLERNLKMVTHTSQIIIRQSADVAENKKLWDPFIERLNTIYEKANLSNLVNNEDSSVNRCKGLLSNWNR